MAELASVSPGVWPRPGLSILTCPPGCCGKNAAQGVDLASPAFEAQQGLERIHLLTKTQASPR